MNPEIQAYYRNSSPRRLLDDKLAPLFDRIRTRKIHCLYQLNQDKTISQSSFGAPINCNIPLFHNKHERKQKLERLKMKQGLQQRKSQQKLLVTLSENEPSEKIMLISLKSKIKRHLVDQIDYQSIEHALFQKRQRVTRFQQFCNTLRQKQKLIAQHRQLYNYSQQIGIGTIQINSQRQSFIHKDPKRSFRVTRKRFSPIDKKSQKKVNQSPLALSKGTLKY